MMEFLHNLVFWHWWVLAVLLVILEALAPGVIFLWLGLGAGITGFVILVQPGLEWEIQLVVFAVFSVIAGIGGRMWVSRQKNGSDETNLNRRGEQYIGRVFTLDEAIVNGVGKIRVGDSHWRASGEDMPSGSRVTVVEVEGATLQVVLSEPAKDA